MLGTPKCCGVQKAPCFLPIKLRFWCLLFHRAKPTLQGFAWPQGNTMRRTDTCRNGNERSVTLGLYSLPFSSYSLLQQYWDSVPAANSGCDQCVIRSGQGSSSAGTAKRFGLSPNASTEATPELASGHWGFGQRWKASGNDSSHCHFNAFTNPELEGPEDYAKLSSLLPVLDHRWHSLMPTFHALKVAGSTSSPRRSRECIYYPSHKLDLSAPAPLTPATPTRDSGSSALDRPRMGSQTSSSQDKMQFCLPAPSEAEWWNC